MSVVGWEIMESSGKFVCRKDTYEEAGRFLARCDPNGSLGFRLAEAKEVSAEACRQYHKQRMETYHEGRAYIATALGDVAKIFGVNSDRYAELAKALHDHDAQYSGCTPE